MKFSSTGLSHADFDSLGKEFAKEQWYTGRCKANMELYNNSCYFQSYLEEFLDRKLPKTHHFFFYYFGSGVLSSNLKRNLTGSKEGPTVSEAKQTAFLMVGEGKAGRGFSFTLLNFITFPDSESNVGGQKKEGKDIS